MRQKKRLVIRVIEKAKLRAEITDPAVEMAAEGARIVVFVTQLDETEEIRKTILKRKPPVSVEVLTGTMRGLERDKFSKKPILKRFLNGDERPEDQLGKEPAVLVSTSAGEVGFDLNADYMICDAAPLDSMVQRLGRVKRRGYGNALVRVLAAKMLTTCESNVCGYCA